MKFATMVFMAFACLAAGCNNPKEKVTQAPEPPKDTSTKQVIAAPPPKLTPDVAKELAKLSHYMKTRETPMQHLVVPVKENVVLKGSHGTLIHVDPTDFVMQDGQPVVGDINVDLKEMTTKEELLNNYMQTVSDGKPLESGGAYYINMTCAGEQIKFKMGHSLKIQFPKLSSKDMSVFYGRKDSSGTMNWVGGTQKFTVTAKMGEDGTAKKDTANMLKGLKSGKMSAAKFKKAALSDTGKGKNLRIGKNKADSLHTMVYDELAIQSFGYINCDRFLGEENLTNLTYGIDPKDSIVCAEVFLAFTDINSVMTDVYEYNERNYFSNIPVGTKAIMIALAFKNGRVYTSKTEVTVDKSKRVYLSLKLTQDKDLQLLFKLKPVV